MKNLFYLMLIILLLVACNEDSTDTTPPAIILIGGDLELPLGTTYVEPGVMAEDETDGITYSVTSTNNIDKHKVGSYTVTYTAKDKAGNEGTKTRKVNYNATLLAGSYQVSLYSETNHCDYSTSVSFVSSVFNKLVFSKFTPSTGYPVFYYDDFAILIDKNTFTVVSDSTLSFSTIYGEAIATVTGGTIDYEEGTAGQWLIKSINYSLNIKYSNGTEQNSNMRAVFE